MKLAQHLFLGAEKYCDEYRSSIEVIGPKIEPELHKHVYKTKVLTTQSKLIGVNKDNINVDFGGRGCEDFDLINCSDTGKISCFANMFINLRVYTKTWNYLTSLVT